MFDELQLQLIQSFMARLQMLPPRLDNQFYINNKGQLHFRIKNIKGNINAYNVAYNGKVFELFKPIPRSEDAISLGTFKNEAKLVKYLEKENLK